MKMTGNPIVDKMYGMAITGNVTPQNWYHTVVNEKGRPVMNAITILSEIVYWYRPKEERDEAEPEKSHLKKKFRADLLQMSYQKLEEKFGLGRSQVKDAVRFLEKLGVINREFRKVMANGTQMNNVMFLVLNPERLYELTYPEKGQEADDTCAYTVGAKAESAHRSVRRINTPVAEKQTDFCSDFDTALPKKLQTNTEIISESISENRKREYPSVYQETEDNFRKQIEYEVLCSDYPRDLELIDEIVRIASEAIASDKSKLRVNGEELPADRVRDQLSRIDFLTMTYILDSVKQSKTEVRNVQAMLLTTMYNAPGTRDTYYENKVKHDMLSGKINVRQDGCPEM